MPRGHFKPQSQLDDVCNTPEEGGGSVNYRCGRREFSGRCNTLLTLVGKHSCIFNQHTCTLMVMLYLEGRVVLRPFPSRPFFMASHTHEALCVLYTSQPLLMIYSKATALWHNKNVRFLTPCNQDPKSLPSLPDGYCQCRYFLAMKHRSDTTSAPFTSIHILLYIFLSSVINSTWLDIQPTTSFPHIKDNPYHISHWLKHSWNILFNSGSYWGVMPGLIRSFI